MTVDYRPSFINKYLPKYEELQNEAKHSRVAYKYTERYLSGEHWKRISNSKTDNDLKRLLSEHRYGSQLKYYDNIRFVLYSVDSIKKVDIGFVPLNTVENLLSLAIEAFQGSDFSKAFFAYCQEQDHHSIDTVGEIVNLLSLENARHQNFLSRVMAYSFSYSEWMKLNIFLKNSVEEEEQANLISTIEDLDLRSRTEFTKLFDFYSRTIGVLTMGLTGKDFVPILVKKLGRDFFQIPDDIMKKVIHCYSTSQFEDLMRYSCEFTYISCTE